MSIDPRHAGRIPPHDLDAEAAVLAAVLLDRSGLDRVSDILAPERFYSDANGRVYEAALAVAAEGKPIDLVTVSAWLRSRELLAAAGGPSYLAMLADASPAVEHAAAHAETVRAKWRIRRAIETCHRAAAEGYGDVGDPQEWLNGLERDVFALAQSSESADATVVLDVIRSAFTKIQAADERGDAVTGLPTGLVELDKLLGGLQRGDVTILAARPGMGKTALAMGAALSVAESTQWVGAEQVRQTAAFFSLEMPREQLGTRMIYSEAGVNSTKLRYGRLTPDNWTDLTTAATAVSRLPLWIDDKAGLKPGELRARVRRLKAIAQRSGWQLGLVVVDYLQLMNGRDLIGKGGSRENEITAISKSLKEIAKECDVHVLALSQLNRDVEKRSDRRPMLADLRESGAIEQDADNVIFVYREAYYEPESKEADGKAELIVAKQRNGPLGKVMVGFREDCVRFENLTGGPWVPTPGPGRGGA